MGVACGDLEGDGRPGLVTVTSFYNEVDYIFPEFQAPGYLRRPECVDRPCSGPAGYVLGFGIAFSDADSDGWLRPDYRQQVTLHDGRPQFPWKMPAQLFLNDGRGKVTRCNEACRSPFPDPTAWDVDVAAGDLDNDGWPDVVVVSQNEPVALV